MKAHIFDVEHGFCAAVEAPSGDLLLVDCGHNSTTGWRPSAWLMARGLRTVTNLTVSNFDEDHLSDLPSLRRMCKINSLSTNRNVSADWVAQAKRNSGGVGPGVAALLEMMNTYTGPAPTTDWGGCDVQRFCHAPPLFGDTNGLSLLTFVSFGALHMLFPGDLTTDAWKEFIRDDRFRRMLLRVNVFVASHHGRQDGYCPEVFNYCHPPLIVVSDEALKYETQLVDYAPHATGISWNEGGTTSTRWVLTTRKDGHMHFDDRQSSFHVTVGESY